MQQQLEPDMEQHTGSKSGKEYVKAVYCHPAYLTYIQSISCKPKMGSIKDRNGMGLTEAEDIKKRWQEYTEELYKKDLHSPDNHDGVITHPEPNNLGHSKCAATIFSLHSFFEQFLIFYCHSMVQDHLVFSLPQPWKSSFL